MKNINTVSIGLLILFFTSSSCKKWLKEENFTRISSDAIYKDEAGLEVGLGGLYNLQRVYERTTDQSTNGPAQNNLWLYCADDLGCTRTYNDAQIYKAGMNPTDFPRGKWSYGYQLIDRASAVINAAAKVTFANPVRKNQLIGEAKVIRAYTYFKLWQLYDNILIDTIPTTAENAFDPVVYKPASKTDVLNLINSDLDFAIANLSFVAKPGQINQGFARHLRAQAAAWQGDWATMAAQIDSIVGSGKFSLQPIEKVFGQDVNHSEAIFTYQLDELSGGSEALSGGGACILGGVFQSRYYEMPDNHIIEDNNLGGNSLGWTLPNDYLRSLYNPDPVTGISADKRFTNYYYPDSIIGNKPGDPYYGQPLPKSSYPDNYRQYHWSVMKYKDIVKSPGTYQSYKDIIVCRYAETLLLGAEAHWRLTNNPSDPMALQYINKVRDRAGAPSFTTIDQQTILDESARELAFEGGRWFLLKRMGVLISQVNAHHTFGSAKTNETVYPMQSWMVRWPIPQDQIDLMGPDFPQNPGY